MNRTRPKQIVIRATEKEIEQIQSKVKKSKLNQNEYLLRSALAKEIIVIEGVHELTTEIKRIGNNLNQLTRAVHEGKVECSKELSEVNEELKRAWQLLRSLTQKQG